MNGVVIVGADSNVYFVTDIGLYNMTKTNTNGCTDSATVGINITLDPNCTGSIEDAITDNNITIYPVPFTDVINISSDDNEIQKILITDIKGSVSSEIIVDGLFTSINTSSFKAGVYFLRIITTEGVIIKQIIKQ